MNYPDEKLMAYADGELEGVERTQLEAALATDPDLARRVAAHRALRTTLAATYGKVLQEPVPERLTSRVRGALDGARGAKALAFRHKPRSQQPWRQWGALAAGLVLGAVLWQFGARSFLSGPVLERNGELVAAGALARALNNQLAGGQASKPVQIGVSFLSKNGDYCRTFQLRGRDGIAGLACRRQAEWKLQVLALGAGGAPVSQYRQAASALPPAVLQAVTDSIAGEPLDAAAEDRARASSWRAR